MIKKLYYEADDMAMVGKVSLPAAKLLGNVLREAASSRY